MDISLVLREKRPGHLVYAIPAWYRVLMLAIAAVLVASILVTGDGSGAVPWIIFGIALVASLYEERWVVDAEARVMRHRFGLLPLARTIVLPFERIEGFRLRAFVRGSNPGAPNAAEESSRIIAALDPTGDANALRDRRSRLKRAYISLICDDTEGGGLVINTLPARRASELKTAGSRLASAAGKSLVAD